MQNDPADRVSFVKRFGNEIFFSNGETLVQKSTEKHMLLEDASKNID